MVKVEKSSDGKIATLTGSECEVMLFYCFWQSKLWPDWMNDSKLGDESDAATRQHKEVIENVNAGRELLLHNAGETFHTAIRYATDKCELLGIEVSAA